MCFVALQVLWWPRKQGSQSQNAGVRQGGFLNLVWDSVVVVVIHMRFSKTLSVLFGGSSHQGFHCVGSMLGAPDFWKVPYSHLEIPQIPDQMK